MSFIKETDLPGIGKKFEVNPNSRGKFVIVLHDDGRREIHHFDEEDPEEIVSVVTLDDAEVSIEPFSALYVLILAILGPLLTKESYWVYGKLARIFNWPLPAKSKKRKAAESFINII